MIPDILKTVNFTQSTKKMMLQIHVLMKPQY